MPIITLTTDLQEQDYYVGALKGVLLSHCPEATLVDISHSVEAFNLMQGAFLVQNSWHEFPEGTIHLVGVNVSQTTGNDPFPRFLVAVHQGHYFLGPDNGLFSLIFEQSPEQVYALPRPETVRVPSFLMKEQMGRAAGQLARGVSVDDIADPAESMEELTPFQPVYQEDFIQGSVIHIDAYKNAISNIGRSLFEEIGEGKRYRIYYARKESVEEIHHNYNDVPEGEVVCLFGSSGKLEVAINKAPAAHLLGLEVGDPIQIEFL